MKIMCVVPPLHFPVNELGHGYQPPLGLLAIAGPLCGAGYDVSLLDADAAHLTNQEVVQRVTEKAVDIVLIGHSGSMAAHPNAMLLIENLKRALPNVLTVYGGVYPSYAFNEIMKMHRAVDFLIRGEGEETILALIDALDNVQSLADVYGLVWRQANEIVVNPPRQVTNNLDAYRIAWELVDWPLYRSRHTDGHSAIVQFSRGCPHTCSYCGQWMFWRRWRHRSIQNFVDDLQLLHDCYGVRSIWLADENIGANESIFKALLEAICARQLSLAIFCALCAEDVLRDQNILPLYRKAGIVCLMMGVESFDDQVLQRIGKDNPHQLTKLAVTLLREQNILSVVNVIYGLREETLQTMMRTFFDLIDIAPDFLNALHLTPLGWTKEGRNITSEQIVQRDQRLWHFRLPVVRTKHFSPRTFAILVKLTEAAFFFRPAWLWSRFFMKDRLARQIFRDATLRLARVYVYEWFELFRAKFLRRRVELISQDEFMLLMPRTNLRKNGDKAYPINLNQNRKV